jgi:hypothetical protein
VDDEREFEVDASFMCDVVLTDWLGVTAEYVGFYQTSDPSSEEHYLTGHVTFVLSTDVQLDATAGLGLTKGSDDFLAGVGLSFRFCLWRCEEYRQADPGG